MLLTYPPFHSVDELYRFINTWVQHLYGELNEEQIKARGFELIQDDTEWTKSGTSKSGRSGSQENEEISDLTRESWEVSTQVLNWQERFFLCVASVAAV